MQILFKQLYLNCALSLGEIRLSLKKLSKIEFLGLKIPVKKIPRKLYWTDCIMGKILKKVEIGKFITLALKSIL